MQLKNRLGQRPSQVNKHRAADSRNRVRELRFERGLGSEELAARAQISRTALYHIENGKTSDPRASTMRRIARALGVEPHRLLDDFESAEPEVLSSLAKATDITLVATVPAAYLPQDTRADAEWDWRADVEIEAKLRRLLRSPWRNGVAAIIEQAHLMMSPPDSNRSTS